MRVAVQQQHELAAASRGCRRCWRAAKPAFRPSAITPDAGNPRRARLGAAVASRRCRRRRSRACIAGGAVVQRQPGTRCRSARALKLTMTIDSALTARRSLRCAASVAAAAVSQRVARQHARARRASIGARARRLRRAACGSRWPRRRTSSSAARTTPRRRRPRARPACRGRRSARRRPAPRAASARSLRTPTGTRRPTRGA